MVKRILLLRMNAPIRVNTPHPYAFKFPFMLKYMEALLSGEAGYEVRLVDCQNEFMTLEELSAFSFDYSPDLAVLFTTTPDYPYLLDFAASFKKRSGACIVCVGQDVTYRPEKYLFPGSPFDIAILGEAELDLVRVIEKLNNGAGLEEIKKEYLARGEIILEEPDKLPFPLISEDDVEKYGHVYPIPVDKRARWGHILSSRGCPHGCIFCSQIIRESYGKKVRLRSPGNVVDEMEYLKARGADIISFDDDSFTMVKEHVTGICGEIQKRQLKIKWISHSRVDDGVTAGLLGLMRESGCALLRFGVESGSGRVLKVLNKTDRNDWNGTAVRVFKACGEAGISTAALFLIGNPTETKQDIYESMRLARDLRPDIIQVSFFTAYPGSEAFKRFEKETAGLDTSRVYHYSGPAVNLSAVDTPELRELYKKFYKTFLLNPGFMLRHLIKYASFYFHNPAVFFKLLKIRDYLFGKT